MILQLGGVPGIELAVFNVIVAALVGYFTYRDASRRRGVNATLWAVVMALASLFLSLLGFLLIFAVYYFLVIRE